MSGFFGQAAGLIFQGVSAATDMARGRLDHYYYYLAFGSGIQVMFYFAVHKCRHTVVQIDHRFVIFAWSLYIFGKFIQIAMHCRKLF